MKLVLASASPRRAEILQGAGFSFEVRPTNVDESRHANEPPAEYVRRLAVTKARAVSTLETQDGETIVIGADTIVSVGDVVFGKPASADEARATLTKLSGSTHAVLTGVAVIGGRGARERVEHELTRVTFAPLTAQEIQEYIDSGEPFGKAGAYAIQGLAGKFVQKLDGDYSNVMGLPLRLVHTLLMDAKWPSSVSAADDATGDALG
jgi:septum formation protein